MQRTVKKRKRQCETCIQCRSSRKQCDKGNPCRQCAENNRKCLYAKEFPYSNLSQEQQAVILEQLLFDTKHKYTQLKMHFKQSDFATTNNNKQQHTRLDGDVYDWIRQQITTNNSFTSNWPISRHQGAFQRQPKRMTLFHDLNKTMTAPMVSAPSELDIDIARSMVSIQEVDILIAMYNECYTFSSLPDFITPHLDENNDYDLLVSSVMTLMCTHAVQWHAMKIDNHQYLSATFYHYTRALLTARMATLGQQSDTMCLHTAYNLMLYETENGYLEEATHTRQAMAVMITSLDQQYTSMSVWQQSVLRHLFWAIYTSDASRHDLQLPDHIVDGSYMLPDKQRPSDQPAQPVDRLKEEYIYYRCLLAGIIRRIDTVCYNNKTDIPVPGQDVKDLESQLWDLYHALPKWMVGGKPLASIQLTEYDGYYQQQQHQQHSTRPSADPCIHSRSHPACQETLDQVWMRRLRYQFLIEWHSTFLYLYQIFLQPTNTDLTQQLVLTRCFEHGKCMVDILAQWVDDDSNYIGCYCLPVLRPLMLVSHIHRSLLLVSQEGIRNTSYAILLKLSSVIRRSYLYPLYKDKVFNWEGDIDQNQLNLAPYSQNGNGGGVFRGGGIDTPGNNNNLGVYTTTTS
ncbi:hypothetical protein BC941DRAFT_500692 [Chlamydoabsidia padenii]|nr:hypothetical protein BC941DRAFT_500692 [Chlamydoabsidia padenii]